MTFDGYGRLQTKHVPEQNSNTATTYSYNNDDTVNSVTDARGSYATYSYNNRHLVTGIVYTPSAGVNSTSSVGYGYDAAGNRTSMTDGFGSKSYAYNQLSQMTSETRTFTGVGTFTLSYDYNLGGELKKITDATNMTINYAFDSIGRFSGVTGSDSLYANVSNYASNFQYRAWGGLKAMTDGTSHTTSALYNQRLQPTHFEISGSTVSQDYNYFNDGRMSFVHNTIDANFDRAYSFDHAGRVTSATTGGAARQDTGDVPYYETFAYDSWNNTTYRFTETWVDDDFYDAATYSNGRRSGWGYDADGRIKTINNRQYNYDAAGNQVAMTGQIWMGSSYAATTIASGTDGDGNKVQEVSTFPSTLTTYYLRSSALGGAIVEELSSAGQKQTGYVYSPSGELLARQSGSVVWKHSTPGGTGQYEIYQGGYLHRIEFDPSGADVGLTAPPPPDTHGDPGDIGSSHNGGPMDSRFGDLSNPGGGCVGAIDANLVPCGLFDRGSLAIFDISKQPTTAAPSATVSSRYVNGDGGSHGSVDYTTNTVTIYADEAPLIEDGVLSLSMALTLGTALPQNPAQQNSGTISGTVVDPCADAVVAATPKAARNNARTSVPLILDTATEANLTTAQTAYVLASSFHESQLGRFMTEIWGPTATQAGYEGRSDLGNTQAGDGYRFRGRGFIQITGRQHYGEWSQLLGDDLIGNPALATDPQIAAQIAVYGMQMGQFTGRALDQYINEGGTDFYNARSIVNGDKRINGQRIARYAEAYLKALEGCK
jgi:YD repeat-containing protein